MCKPDYIQVSTIRQSHWTLKFLKSVQTHELELKPCKSQCCLYGLLLLRTVFLHFKADSALKSCKTQKSTSLIQTLLG